MSGIQRLGERHGHSQQGLLTRSDDRERGVLGNRYPLLNVETPPSTGTGTMVKPSILRALRVKGNPRSSNKALVPSSLKTLTAIPTATENPAVTST